MQSDQRSLRVVVHDYSGHPFQVELSRELARRGHDVTHQYSAEYLSGHGRLTRRSDDPGGFRTEAVSAGLDLRKYDVVARLRYELGYARAWLRLLRRDGSAAGDGMSGSTGAAGTDGVPGSGAARVDVVIVCNVPLFALARVRRTFPRLGVPWILWHQDLYSSAVGEEIRRRLPAPVAGPLAAYATRLEAGQVRGATRVVAISASFLDRYREWGLDAAHAEVLPNWAPLDDIRPVHRDNGWASQHALAAGRLRLLYAGTLGRKHNPLLLLELLDAVRARGVDADLVVCSEGAGADDLAAAAARPGVHLFGFQPAEDFSDVLGSADVLVALLEPTASQFSVPSKVLSYLSAGRPVVLLAPADNPACEDVLRAGGFVGDPTPQGAAAAAAWLEEVARRPGELERLGRVARELAEQRFGIAPIADHFEAAMRSAVRTGPTPGRRQRRRRPVG